MKGDRIYLRISDHAWAGRADENLEHRAAILATHTFSMACRFSNYVQRQFFFSFHFLPLPIEMQSKARFF